MDPLLQRATQMEAPSPSQELAAKPKVYIGYQGEVPSRKARRQLCSIRSQPNFIGKNASGTHDATLQHIMMTDADSEGYVQDDTSAATDDSITDDEESLVKQGEP